MGIKFENKAGAAAPAAESASVDESAAPAATPADPTPVEAAPPAGEVDGDDDLPPFHGSTKVVEQKPDAAALESESVTVTKAAKKAAKKTTKKVTKKAAATDAEVDGSGDPEPAAEPDAKPVFEVKVDDGKVTGLTVKDGVTHIVADSVKVEKVQPHATVNIKHASGVEEQTQVPVGDPIIKAEPMANVGMNMGYTHGLPQYSNIKFGVSLFMPSKTDEESLNATFKLVEEWVDGKMQQLRADLIEGDE